jgi:hypothetical protein
MQTRLKLLAAMIAVAPLAAPFATAQDMPPVAVAAYVPPEPAADAATAIAQSALQPASQPVFQPASLPISQSSFSRQELEQMLAPIALYPDAMLSQILMASTYPLEVVQAARWSREHPSLAGDDAAKAVQRESWDPSVKSLVALPQVLGMLDQNIGWMERLGDAVIGQQAQVTQTVQSLRQRAQASGNLASNDHVQVEQQGGDIALQPADPQEVSVPYYDPSSVYGQWTSPQYPPAYLAPPPADYYVQTAPGFYWGPAVLISAGFFFGGIDWHHHRINVTSGNPGVWGHLAGPGVWRHDPLHRRGVAYAGMRQQFGQQSNHSSAAYASPRAEWRGPSQAMLMPRAAAAPIPVAERTFERPAPQALRDMPPRGSPGGLPMPMRLAEVHSFGPQTYSYHSTSYAPMFSGAGLAHGSPHAPVAFAHFGGGGGGAHVGGGGGGHGGGHGGGGHRR